MMSSADGLSGRTQGHRLKAGSRRPLRHPGHPELCAEPEGFGGEGTGVVRPTEEGEP